MKLSTSFLKLNAVYAHRAAAIALTFVLALAASAQAEDAKLPDIPEFAPNPFKKPTTAPVKISDNIKELERTLYGSFNEDKPDDLRISALERTIFGTSYLNSKLSLVTRTAGLEKVVDALVQGRQQFEEKHWSESKTSLNEVLKLLGKDYKSLVRAEAHYRIGMCDYELSNIARAGSPGVKINGAMIATCRDNLGKAQDYYKSLGQIETADKISKFMNSFKDQAEKSFLY